jgi:rhamnosyl/mannosyltransferase
VRVLHLGKFYPPHRGGIETHLKALCEGLGERGVVVEVLVANDQARASVEMINGILVWRLHETARLAGAPICPALVRRIRATEADLIHLHMPNPFAALAVLLSGKQTPMVISWHSDIVRQRFGRIEFAPFERATVKRSRALIASSPNYVRSSAVLSRNREHCEVIPYGIRAEDYQKANAITVANLRGRYGGRIVLTVGRLVDYKGFAHLIRAMRDIGGHLLIAGTGPRRRCLERETAAARLGGRVTFLGELPVADLIACYHAAEVFVLPSVARSEAFGIVQLEAMACGRPVVNTRIDSGAPFVSIDGETGITVAPGSATALAKAINRLLDNPELRASYGAAAARRVREYFGLEAMVERTLSLYQRVLDGSPRDDCSGEQVAH